MIAAVGTLMLPWFVAAWIMLGVGCATIATSKNRTENGWMLLGLAFGIFAFIVIAFLPPCRVVFTKDGNRKLLKTTKPEPEKQCHACAEYIKVQARRCRFCGADQALALKAVQATV